MCVCVCFVLTQRALADGGVPRADLALCVGAAGGADLVAAEAAAVLKQTRSILCSEARGECVNIGRPNNKPRKGKN